MNTNAPTSASSPLRSLLHRLPPTSRGHTVAVIGEFVGTTSFLFFAFAGTQVANISSNTNTGTTVVTTVQQVWKFESIHFDYSGICIAKNTTWIWTHLDNYMIFKDSLRDREII